MNSSSKKNEVIYLVLNVSTKTSELRSLIQTPPWMDGEQRAQHPKEQTTLHSLCVSTTVPVCLGRIFTS